MQKPVSAARIKLPIDWRDSVCRTVAILAALLLAAAALGSEEPAPGLEISANTRSAVRLLVGDVLVNGQAVAYDEHLADSVGPRLTGSTSYARAVEWTMKQFESLGLSQVHTEMWTIPDAWQPKTLAIGRILAPIEHELHIYSVGWSPSTPPHGVEAEVIYVPSMDSAALDQQKAQLAGAIALIDDASFGAAHSADMIFPALQHLRSLGIKALLVPGGANGTEVSGTRNFSGSIDPLPEAQIGTEDLLLIKRLLQRNHVRVNFSFANTIRRNVSVANVVAQITGAELPDEVVLVGAHLDSWQPGTGAQDNGTGVSMVLEAARGIAALRRPPRRTVRFVLFGGEEQGLLGSSAYVREHKADLQKIDAVLVADSGSEAAKGWYLMGREDEKESVVALKPLLAGLGADDLTSSTEFLFQSDHAPFDVNGVPSLVLWTATDKYEQLHHKASDTFDSVVKKDLSQDAAVVAVTAYAIADSKERFAPHLSDGEVRTMLQATDHFDEYQYLRANGVLP
jgi:carboxypeptidase Q